MGHTPKIRLDQALLQRGLADTIEESRAIIMAGLVKLAGKRVDKAGVLVAADAQLEVEATARFVSRGGDKLEPALKHFGVSVADRVCIDVGSSTGGFTDCLLQHGASRVYAVDVGKGQLDFGLRNDKRVVVLEGVNARYLDDQIGQLSPRPTLAVMDLSFISLTLVLPALLVVLEQSAQILTLVKPQFELPAEQVSPGGVVPEPELQMAACEKVAGFCRTRGLTVSSPFASTVRGQKAGNQEYFLLIGV